jgi:hypothetical protein
MFELHSDSLLGRTFQRLAVTCLFTDASTAAVLDDYTHLRQPCSLRRPSPTPSATCCAWQGPAAQKRGRLTGWVVQWLTKALQLPWTDRATEEKVEALHEKHHQDSHE